MSENKKQNAFSTAFSCVVWPFVVFVAGYFIPFFVCKASSVDYATQLGTSVTGAYGFPAVMWLITYTWGLIVKKSRPGDTGFLHTLSVCFSITALVVFATYLGIMPAGLRLASLVSPILIIIMVFSLITDVFLMPWIWTTTEGKIAFVLEIITISAVSMMLIRPQGGCLEKLFGL